MQAHFPPPPLLFVVVVVLKGKRIDGTHHNKNVGAIEKAAAHAEFVERPWIFIGKQICCTLAHLVDPSLITTDH